MLKLMNWKVDEWAFRTENNEGCFYVDFDVGLNVGFDVTCKSSHSKCQKIMRESFIMILWTTT